MAKVTVDGIDYIPATNTTRISVAITTHNRAGQLTKTVQEHLKHLPAGATLIVVDDGSQQPVTVPDGVRLVRHENAQGVARAKNAALAALHETDADHWFMFDDDAWPLVDDWWKPYVDSPEPHLMAIYDKPKGETKRQVEVLYEDDEHVYYHATRGYMLYVERRVVDRVGGMDPNFGRWGWEHQSWSDRIHAAGFTTARYMDVKDSGELIYSMDQAGEITSTATDEARRYSTGPGLELRMESRHSDKYIEYRTLDDVVLTSMLCAQNDPQRGQKLSAHAKQVKALHDSLKHRFVVLTTGLESAEVLPNAEIVKVDQHINPYFQRWINYYQWLRDHPEVGRVWCVDATDVTMNRDPFPEMVDGKLYMGHEPDTLRNEWMLKNHPDTMVNDFMTTHPNNALLNMGVVGGDRETIMGFAQKVIKTYFDDHIDFIYGWETKRLGVGDMGAGQYVAYTHYPNQLEYGPHIVNVFKTKTGTTNPWWWHKAED